MYTKSDLSLREIETIISHFNHLITQKRADFELFKLIINKLNNKEHLTSVGLDEIISICASMNLGLPIAVKNAFPHIVPVNRPLITDMKITNPLWMAGFISGEGSFSAPHTCR